MQIGDLKRRVELQKTTNVTDNMGGYTQTWATEKTVWAAIWPVSASEQMKAGQMLTTVTHRIRIRYRSDIKSYWRIKYGARYFSIVSMINVSENSEWLDLLAKEAV